MSHKQEFPKHPQLNDHQNDAIVKAQQLLSEHFPHFAVVVEDFNEKGMPLFTMTYPSSSVGIGLLIRASYRMISSDQHITPTQE